MKCNFVVGQMVVCSQDGNWINDNPKEPEGEWMKYHHPEFGKVYKITHIYVSLRNGGVYLRLEGFLSSYNHRSFSPVQERKTDIGWAHEILRRVTNKELV